MNKTLPIVTALFFSCALSVFADSPSSAKAREAARLFKNYDTNGDGSISFEEYKAGQGDNMSAVRLPKVFAEKDRNGDGKLSIEELLFVPSDQKTPPPAVPAKDKAKPAK